MFKGTVIGLLEITFFFIISYIIRKSYNKLYNINTISYYWIMLTILTGIWEFSFITNYSSVNRNSTELIKTHSHVWTNTYGIDALLPWNLAYIFYAEYGAYADREYMITKDDWSRVIEGTHAVLCAILSLASILLKVKGTQYNNLYFLSLGIAMGSQLMNSILYLVNYFIQCQDSSSINYNSESFPTGIYLDKRPFMYVNIFWFVMPSYVITSYLNLAHLILSYPILSYLILSCYYLITTISCLLLS